MVSFLAGALVGLITIPLPLVAGYLYPQLPFWLFFAAWAISVYSAIGYVEAGYVQRRYSAIPDES